MTIREYLSHINNRRSEIAHLTCINKGITSLEGVEALQKLIYLDCANNYLTSLKGIEALPNLKFLHCDGNNIKSTKALEPIFRLKNLKELQITSSGSINALPLKKQLKYLKNINGLQLKATLNT